MKREHTIFSFQWHFTDLCNLRCRHCYQKNFNAQKDKTPREWNQVFDSITRHLKKRGYRAMELNVTGGEPLYCPSFTQIIKLLEEKDFIQGYFIITNGIHLERYASFCTQQPKFRGWKISIESHSSQENDKIRGKGSFQKVQRNIVKLSSPWIAMFTLHKDNYLHLPEMIDLCNDWNAEGLIIERFIPWGRGNIMKEKTAGSKEWKFVLSYIASLLACDAEELFPYRAFYFDFVTGDIAGAFCNLGGDSMALMPDGTVYPCRRFPISVGNVFTTSFSTILDNLTGFRNRFLPEKLHSPCRHCSFDSCSGCRALVYALSGSFYAADPQCPENEKVF